MWIPVSYTHLGTLRGGRKDFKKNDWRSGGYKKKSENPDVLYGRDFEDDFIELEKIEGEIGEVTVRGKICLLYTSRCV